MLKMCTLADRYVASYGEENPESAVQPSATVLPATASQVLPVTAGKPQPRTCASTTAIELGKLEGTPKATLYAEPSEAIANQKVMDMLVTPLQVHQDEGKQRANRHDDRCYTRATRKANVVAVEGEIPSAG